MGTVEWAGVKQSKLSHGLLAGVLLAVLFALATEPIINWVYGGLYVPNPEHSHYSPAESITHASYLWFIPLFIILYLLPLFAVDYIAGLGWKGLAGITVYSLVWWVTATYVELPTIFMKALLVALPIILAFKVTTWVYSGRANDGYQAISNDIWDW